MELREYLVRVDHFVSASSPEEAARISLDFLQDDRCELTLQVNCGKRWWDVVLPQQSGEEFSVTEVVELPAERSWREDFHSDEAVGPVDYEEGE